MKTVVTVVRASFLQNGSEAGTYHLLPEVAERYLDERTGKATDIQKSRSSTDSVTYSAQGTLCAQYQAAQLDLSKPEVYTIVFWRTAGIQVAYTLDEVYQLIRQVINPAALTVIKDGSQSRFFSGTTLVLTVTLERVKKYVQLFELIRTFARRKDTSQ